MEQKELIRLISSALTPGGRAWLVGGTVRDALLNRPSPDIDIVVEDGPDAAARRIASAIGGSGFALDEGRGVYRVVSAVHGVQVDISRLNGWSIMEDLSRRDFTVNAMAAELGQLAAMPPDRALNMLGVIDPHGGLEDLEKGRLRAVSDAVFRDDPLRLLRAFRLSSQLGLVIEENTLGLVRGAAPLIRLSSAERVRDELYIILDGRDTAPVFEAMRRAGILYEILPETAVMDGLAQGGPHIYDLLTHSIKTVSYAEKIMAKPDELFGKGAHAVERFLTGQADNGLGMPGLVKLCAFMHDIGKPATLSREEGKTRFLGHDTAGAGIASDIAGRIMMSRNAIRSLQGMVRNHMRLFHLERQPLTRRAAYRLCRDTKDYLPGLMVVALADSWATDDTGGCDTDIIGLADRLLEFRYGEYEEALKRPLITGKDLIDVFGLSPGPVFRKILGEVEEMAAAGEIHTRDEALKFVEGMIREDNK